MATFDASAALSVTVDQSSLRSARSTIESELGGVSVSVDSGGVSSDLQRSARQRGARGGGGVSSQLQETARQRSKENAMSRQLADQQLDVLGEHSESWDENLALNDQRNDYLKEILEELRSGVSGSSGEDGLLPRAPRLGGLGGLGGLGFLGLSGSVAGFGVGSELIKFLKNFRFNPPKVTIRNPPWLPPSIKKPPWVPLPIEDPAPLPVEDPGPIPVNAPDYIPLLLRSINPTGDLRPSPSPDPRGYGSVTRDRPSPLGDPTPAPDVSPYTPESPLAQPDAPGYGSVTRDRPSPLGETSPYERGSPQLPDNDSSGSGTPGWFPDPEEIIGGVVAGGAGLGMKWGAGSGSGASGAPAGGLPISLAPIFADASSRGPLADILPGGNETVSRNRETREMAFQQSSRNKAAEHKQGSVERVDARIDVSVEDRRDLDRELERAKEDIKREIERKFSGGRVR